MSDYRIKCIETGKREPLLDVSELGVGEESET